MGMGPAWTILTAAAKLRLIHSHRVVMFLFNSTIAYYFMLKFVSYLKTIIRHTDIAQYQFNPVFFILERTNFVHRSAAKYLVHVGNVNMQTYINLKCATKYLQQTFVFALRNQISHEPACVSSVVAV